MGAAREKTAVKICYAEKTMQLFHVLRGGGVRYLLLLCVRLGVEPAANIVGPKVELEQQKHIFPN
jgi:hypothetical protein